MEKLFEQELEKAYELFGKENIGFIYLTGSHLNNLHTKESDVDLFIILKPTKKDVVTNNFVAGSLTNSNGDDFRYMDSNRFTHLLIQTNPNMLELLFRKPLYVDEKFKTFTEFLYENRNELLLLNKERLYSKTYHMIRQNLVKLENSTGKVASGKSGRELLHFYRVYYQYLVFEQGMEHMVYLAEDSEERKFLMHLKTEVFELTEQERTFYLQDMREKVEELFVLKEKMVGFPLNEVLTEQLVEQAFAVI